MRPLTNLSLTLSTLIAAGACAASQESPMSTSTAPPAPTSRTGAFRSGHAPINGVTYYYEIHGDGEPLLLLHGGLGSIDMFGPVLPALAASRQVIAVDLHGHGRTNLGDRKISLPDIGDDLAASPQIVPTVLPFLDGNTAAPSWSAQVSDRGTSR